MTCKGYSNSLSQVRRRMLNADVSVDDDANSLDCWRISSIKSNLCESDSLQCTLGATGPLCGSCESGYFYSSTALVCQPCNSAKLKNLIVPGIGLFIGIVVAALYSKTLFIPEGMRRTWIFFVFQRLDSGTLRVVWSNYQVSLA